MRCARVCFALQVKADRLTEYRERHRNVWPEMQDALRRTGWTNYSLFLRDDGLLIGYLETEDLDAAKAAMSKEPVNGRWQTDMAPFFEGGDRKRADEQMRPLTEIFHLD